MATFSIGSIVVQVHKMIPDIVSAVSCANMDDVVYQRIIYMNNYTGDAIGSNSIAEKYQPALIHLTAADILSHMELVGTDAQSISLGDFSVSKGGASNTTKARDFYLEMGMRELQELGRRARFYKVE